MKNRFTKLLHKNRKMTLLSAILPVISLLIFTGPTGAKLACAYMYIIAPFITLRILGHKFKKVKQPKSLKKKSKAPKASDLFTLNGKQYSLGQLSDITMRNFLIVILSMLSIMFFNNLHLPVAKQLILAGPYLLIHSFFFFTGEPLSILKSFVPLPDRPSINNRHLPSNDIFPRTISHIDPFPKRTDLTRLWLHDGSHVMRTRRE